ncbi:DUF7064 domain-containing protein [Novosphingobium colocasiae]|uniref:Uncharacterized protein n=1 Tax=Novosphingobium colocasiae TaxID=1256513 RepID=A0A918PCZ8_9SPHN|nr:hypothetical protein [Novosphingobium colocasiae]GGY99070.1 hypothetical protein GCM10011614_12480 [Novosphingobium colocasiae]
MIRDEDLRYHTPADVTHDWAETSFFSVYVPEANLTAWVYIIARPGVGAIVCDVEVIDGVGRYSLDARYIDFQQHLPLPQNFESYSLPNGLTFKGHSIRNYQLDYIGVDDTELHWTVEGVMEPFDIHDPAMDPLASTDANASGFGAAYANHFDMTARTTGTLKVRGKEYAIDCVTTMDHSWGPRGERGMRSMGWINGNFSAKDAFQTIWTFNPLAPLAEQFALAHGYVIADGEVRGLTKGRIQAVDRSGPFPSGYEMEVEDAAGRKYRYTGKVVAQHPWPCYSCTFAKFSTVEWTDGSHIGHGLAQENWPLDSLTGKGLAAGA